MLKRYTEILQYAILVKQQVLYLLPEISIFHGDPLQYRTFIKAFTQFIEKKTDSMDDRLHSHSSIQRTNLEVSSFMHVDPTVAYKQAKGKLECNFGNSYKIALAYMNKALNWPAIKPVDGNDRRSYMRSFCAAATTLCKTIV